MDDGFTPNNLGLGACGDCGGSWCGVLYDFDGTM